MTRSVFSALIIALLVAITPMAAAAELQLSFNLTSSTDGFTVAEIEPAVVEITTAPAPALVRFSPIADVPADAPVLSFDYFCASGMESLVPIINGDAIADPVKIDERRLRVPVAEGWSTFSIDMAELIGKSADRPVEISLLVIPNNERPTVMRMRNVRMRQYTEKEKQQAREKAEHEARESRLNHDIAEYLHFTDFPCAVTRVSADDKWITVEGRFDDAAAGYYLCEVPLYGELAERTFITSVPLDGRRKFKQRFSRRTSVDGVQYDRLYSRWVVMRGNGPDAVICSHARYADAVKPANKLKPIKMHSRKGIGGFGFNNWAADLDSLDVSSITFNMWLGNFTLSQQKPDDIAFTYNGRQYFANRKVVERWDRSLKYAAERNITVNAIILINPQRGCVDKEAGRLFEHPDFDPAGIYSMPNMTSLEAMNLYAAVVNFIAERYSRPDNKYGRVHHWIAHNEVDAGWVWTNVGHKTALRFMDIYVKSMRLLYLTARQYNPNSEVLITLTHHWHKPYNEFCYPSDELLNLLLDYSAAEGDFKWGVAHHPYPQSLFEPKTWNDNLATFEFDTPLITFKNLEVLNAWILQPHTFYKGAKRTLILSEQNPNSKDYSEQALAEQAASMAYAMKKLEYCTAIDAYQCHGWFDQRAEGGLRIGLRRFVDDETLPAGRKPAWYVFQAFGTPLQEQKFEFAKPIIGITDWSEILHRQPILFPSK